MIKDFSRQAEIFNHHYRLNDFLDFPQHIV